MANNDYAYIVGRIRALETQMMDQTLLDRLLESSTAEEAFRALNDHPLLVGGMGDYNVNDFQKVLLGGLKSMQELITQMAPDKGALDFLWHKFNFHNLKVVLKAKLAQRGYDEVDHALVPLGTVNFDDWQKYLLEDKPLEFADGLSTLIDNAAKEYEKTSDPQMVDLMVDRFYMSAISRIADRLDSPLITKYLARLIDYTNLRSFIRATQLKKDGSYLAKVLISGGTIGLDVFIGSFEKGYDDLKQALDSQLYGDGPATALASYIETNNLLLSEKKMTDALQKFMNEAMKISFGIEPVFAFFFRFENHLQIIRTILVGKLNQLEKADITTNIPAI